ncbi:MAG: XdhC family protein [Opitutaceae bacterium]|jgi:xanthine/CO dehydrogenase XdhC/CoxF family maturation factor
MKELQAIVGHLNGAKRGGVLATLVTVEGSSYRKPGARMLVTEDGLRIGSISGGCLEEDLIERSGHVSATGLAELAVYDTTADNDLLWGVGLGCHGVIRVLLEPVRASPDWAAAVADNFRAGRATDLAVVWGGPGPRGTFLREGRAAARLAAAGVFLETVEPLVSLSIFGAGDGARPLARLARELGWRVSVADPRPALATEARFPGVASLVTAPADELVARAQPAPGSLAVIMTHHYVHDRPLLRHLLPLPLAYLGMLGAKGRSERILAELSQEGFAATPEMLARLHAPVGLDLGAEGPEEVALCIIAEMMAVLAGRDGRPLRERTLPIHA